MFYADTFYKYLVIIDAHYPNIISIKINGIVFGL